LSNATAFRYFVVGMKDVTNANPDVTLENIGLDSIMGVEMKQTLQHYYGISMSAEEIRALTFAKLDQLSAATSTSQQSAGDTATTAYENTAFVYASISDPSYLPKLLKPFSR